MQRTKRVLLALLLVVRAYNSQICGAVMKVIRFLREVLSDYNGQGSWSRVGSAILIVALAYVIVKTRGVPENTDKVAYVVAALYGLNQLRNFAQKLSEARGVAIPENSQPAASPGAPGQ